MNRLWISLAVVILICCASLPALGQSIETFVLSDLNPAPDRRSRAVVGPNGDTWFTVNNPERLIRIHDSEMECVLDSGQSRSYASEISISPEGQLYFSNLRYIYSPEQGVLPSGVIQPPYNYYAYSRASGIFDADMRMYCTKQEEFINPMGYLWEMFVGQEAILRYTTTRISCPLIVSLNESWTVSWGILLKRDLETGDTFGGYQSHPLSYRLCAKDCLGRLWLSEEDIVIFDGGDFETFAPIIENPVENLFYWHGDLVLSADFTVWAIAGIWSSTGIYRGPIGIERFRDGERVELTPDDGLLPSNLLDDPLLIDYDGNVWLNHYEGFTRISDGGWPPMRLMLHEVATEETIAVEAQVINNGPVVGVDVYVALELNGQLLYWPDWQPEPHANPLNLRPGHNQTATIISAPRATIPPGSYKFHACMTGRGTQKLIGPLDRKFEALTIEVGSEYE